VKKWAILRDRLVEIAKVMRRFLWMVEVVRQSQVSIFPPPPPPYMGEVYVAREGSEACLSHLVERFLRAGRCRKGGEAGAGVQPVRGIRRQDKRGAPPQGAIGIHHSGEGVRKATLTASFSKIVP
jgi:hypothetical protein